MRTLPARQSSGIAIVVHDQVPQGHKLHLIPDNMHWPVLRTGDWAVVDPDWTEIEFGQLYLVQQSRSSVIWQICEEPEERRASRTEPDRPCAWMHPINRPRSRAELEQILADNREMTPPGIISRLPLYMSDGPIYLDALQDLIEGRVIGVYEGAALVAGGAS